MILLICSFGEDPEVRRGPIEPKKEGSNHGKYIGCIIRFGLGHWFDLTAEQSTHSESEIGSKSMNGHTSPRIEGANLRDYSLIEGVANDLNNSHHKKLSGSNSANDPPEGNQH